MLEVRGRAPRGSSSGPKGRRYVSPGQTRLGRVPPWEWGHHRRGSPNGAVLRRGMRAAPLALRTGSGMDTQGVVLFQDLALG